MKVVPYGDPERFSHRLEAFSDIVIGFSLAQLSLSLTIPRHLTDLLHRPFGFFAFVLTFIIVSTLWLRHHKWFEHYFVPTPLNVVLNFAVLGAIVLLVYALQIFLVFVRGGLILWPAFSVYMAAFALVMFLFAVAYFIGVVRPRRSMTEDIHIIGYVQALRLFGAALGVVVGLLIGNYVAGAQWQMVVVVISIIIGAALGRTVGNIIGKRAVISSAGGLR